MRNDLNYHIFYIDDLYAQYKKDKTNIEYTWRKFFEGFEYANQNRNFQEQVDLNNKFLSIWKLIQDYRRFGYTQANINPLIIENNRKEDHNFEIFKFFLNLSNYHLSDEDLDIEFNLRENFLEKESLRSLLDQLKKIYLGNIGFEYAHIQNQDRYKWLLNRIENGYLNFKFDPEELKNAYLQLSKATRLEEYLQLKYIGQKRFSLEGSENLIPLLNQIFLKSESYQVKKVVLSMAHRGRLNVLTNVFEKSYADLFYEFQSTPKNIKGINDAKYHLGYKNKISLSKDFELEAIILNNPSHLESVNPVLMGYTRALLEKENLEKEEIIPILIHGDAAISGQGSSYEQIQMESLEAYTIGGIIHIILDNQVGYTLDPKDAHTSLYCSDIAKIIDAPVFHINGDDTEAILFVSQLALSYRQQFKKDVFIHILAYRKYGHNEMDEPKFTQPNLYKLIDNHPNVLNIYEKKLIDKNIATKDELNKLDQQVIQKLNEEFDKSSNPSFLYSQNKIIEKDSYNENLELKDFEKDQHTKISKKIYNEILSILIDKPEGFTALKQLSRILETRESMYKKDKKINWATAELLSYGSLLKEGYKIRICGEDTQRGTFSHRHALYYDQKTGEKFSPLESLQIKKNQWDIFNSHLSEFGALGFEYGYSFANPEALTIWEAQFGDFVNGAQIIIDQYITSGEEKWGSKSPLILFLPHGYEGQGPEHSSARLERFLQSSVLFNMIVLNMTTPANLFHAIRRQLKSNFRKPLVIMTPKSLLRHPSVVSDEKDILEGKFYPVIDDLSVDPNKISRIILCSGKIYYDLLENKKKDNVAILRLEQIYPFPKNILDSILKRYSKYKELYWVQEEPKNMGAWSYLISHYPEYKWNCISRDFLPMPSSGYHSIYLKEQEDIIYKAFS